MNGYGLAAAAAAGESDTIRVEHVFTFNLSDKWDKPLRRAVDAWLDISFHFAESFRFLAIGMSAYLVLLGASKLIAASTSSKSKSSSSTKLVDDANKPKSRKAS